MVAKEATKKEKNDNGRKKMEDLYFIFIKDKSWPLI